MELLCIDHISSPLEAGKVYTLMEIGRKGNYIRAFIMEHPNVGYYTTRFVINPPSGATEEDIRQLKILWDKLTKLL